MDSARVVWESDDEEPVYLILYGRVLAGFFNGSFYKNMDLARIKPDDRQKINDILASERGRVYYAGWGKWRDVLPNLAILPQAGLRSDEDFEKTLDEILSRVDRNQVARTVLKHRAYKRSVDVAICLAGERRYADLKALCEFWGLDLERFMY